jgi:hypothetical protein
VTGKELISLISIAIFIGSETFYVWSIYRGRARPHVFSWAVWGLITAVAFFAQRTEAAGAGAWVTGFTSAVCFLVAAIALFKGEKNITKSDIVAFICGLISVFVWRATGDPLYAVLIVSAAEVFAFYPTIRKSWLKPWQEPAIPYMLDVVKYLLSLFAMEHYSLTVMFYPIFVSVVQGGFVAMLRYRRAAMARVTK